MEKKYINGMYFKVMGGKYGEFYDLVITDIGVEELSKLLAGGRIRLTISKRKETDKYGNTHSVYLNEYKGEGKKVSESRPPADEDLPF